MDKIVDTRKNDAARWSQPATTDIIQSIDGGAPKRHHTKRTALAMAGNAVSCTFAGNPIDWLSSAIDRGPVARAPPRSRLLLRLVLVPALDDVVAALALCRLLSVFIACSAARWSRDNIVVYLYNAAASTRVRVWTNASTCLKSLVSNKTKVKWCNKQCQQQIK